MISAVDTLWDSWHARDSQNLVLVSCYYFNATVNSCLPKMAREWDILGNGKFWFVWLSSVSFTDSWLPHK